jgi:hypothetical protein
VHLAWVEDPATTLTVVWRTRDVTTPSTIEYREVGATLWLTASGALRTSGTSGTLHEVTLRSLAPATAYEYRVLGDGGVRSPAFTTRTAPAPGPADFTAVYVADTGLIGRLDGLATGTAQVVDEIAALQPTLVLPGGDYIYYDTDRRFGTLDNTIDVWFNQMQPIAAHAPLMPTYGNHEVLLGEGFAPWAARFPTPTGFDGRRYYSFDVGDVHFVSILAVEDLTGLPASALQWIEQDILAAQAARQRWIIPYFHVAPFADGTNHPSNLQLRAQLGPLFERLGVKLVLTSHDQAYERTYPLVDVPATDTPTSSSLTCYTMGDGVTWVKISPGGKLSNINQGFSQFATNPPPAWTAVRNNTRHHFSRLLVSAAGSIRLETYGVVGDGSLPVIVDSFQYTTGVCPGGGVSYALVWSGQANRTGPVALDGAQVSGNIYAFVTPETGVTRVRFYLDNPGMTGAPRQTEAIAPFDFAGTAASELANPFDTASTANGPHTITAAIDRTAGGTEVIHATFTAANSAPALLFFPESVALNVPSGGSTNAQVNLSATTGTASYAMSEASPWLTVSPQAGTTPGTLTLTANASGLAAGTYTATVTAAAAGFTGDTLPVTLTVGGGGVGSHALVWSGQANRTGPVALDGAQVSGNIYAFVTPETGVTRVRFYLDNPGMTGAPRQTENTAPYDFAGGRVATADPFVTSQVTKGSHTITAAIDRTTGGTEVIHATFTVANP